MLSKFRSDKRVIASFLTPALLVYMLFMLLPIAGAIYLSFHTWPGFPGAPFEFVGLRNFEKVFSYDLFWLSVKNILWWILLTLVTQIPIGFLFALLLNERFRGFRVVKSIIFLPQVISITATGLLWYFVLQPNGMLNTFLSGTSLNGLVTSWLVDERTAMTTVILVNAWIGIGFHMTIFFASISGIPETILDSCRMDGVTGFRRIFYVILPLTWDAIKIAIVIAITQSFRSFDLVFVMTNGGPNGLTQIPATLLYRESFRFDRFGLGSTIGLFILGMSLVFTLFSLRLMKRDAVEY